MIKRSWAKVPHFWFVVLLGIGVAATLFFFVDGCRFNADSKTGTGQAKTATCATLPATAVAVPAQRQDLLKPKPQAVEAWKDMRFGMFIHWGPVSLTGMPRNNRSCRQRDG